MSGKLQISEYRFYFSCLGNFRYLNIDETSDIWKIRTSWPRLYPKYLENSDILTWIIQDIWKIKTSRHWLYPRYLENFDILTSIISKISGKFRHLDFDYIQDICIWKIKTSRHLRFKISGNSDISTSMKYKNIWEFQTSWYRWHFRFSGNSDILTSRKYKISGKFRHLDLDCIQDIYGKFKHLDLDYIQNIWKIQTSWPWWNTRYLERDFDILITMRYKMSGNFQIPRCWWKSKIFGEISTTWHRWKYKISEKISISCISIDKISDIWVISTPWHRWDTKCLDNFDTWTSRKYQISR